MAVSPAKVPADPRFEHFVRVTLKGSPNFPHSQQRWRIEGARCNPVGFSNRYTSPAIPGPFPPPVFADMIVFAMAQIRLVTARGNRGKAF